MKANKVIKYLEHNISELCDTRESLENLINISERRYYSMCDLRNEKVGRNNKIFVCASGIIWIFLLVFLFSGAVMTIPYCVAASIYIILFSVLIPNNRKYNKLRKEALKECQELVDSQVMVEQLLEHLNNKKREISLDTNLTRDYDYQEVINFVPEKPSILKRLLNFK